MVRKDVQHETHRWKVKTMLCERNVYNEPGMKIARREFAKEEKNPTGVRKREARRYEDRVFPLIDERNSTGIGLTDPVIKEEGSSQIRSDQVFYLIKNR